MKDLAGRNNEHGGTSKKQPSHGVSGNNTLNQLCRVEKKGGINSTGSDQFYGIDPDFACWDGKVN